MNLIQMTSIVDETIIEDLTDYEELSYRDNHNVDVELFHRFEFVDFVKVFLDHEENNREYICINSEIIYLDTINKIE